MSESPRPFIQDSHPGLGAYASSLVGQVVTDASTKVVGDHTHVLDVSFSLLKGSFVVPVQDQAAHSLPDLPIEGHQSPYPTRLAVRE